MQLNVKQVLEEIQHFCSKDLWLNKAGSLDLSCPIAADLMLPPKLNQPRKKQVPG